MDRLERLTDLVLVLLRDHNPISLRQIAIEVPGYPPEGEARRQAFERDKRTLRDEGIPVVAEPIDGPDQVGYRIPPDKFYLPDMGLDPEEQAALNLAVAAVHMGDPNGRHALWRLGVDSADGRRPLADLPALPALPQLFEALRDRCSIGFTYRGADRRVHPVRLRFRGGWWYLVGYDMDRLAVRTFRVDRMDSLPKLGDPGSAEVPHGFDPRAVLDGLPWRQGGVEEIPVDVLVDGVVAARCISQVGEDSVVETYEDGSVLLRLLVSNTRALRSWVLEMGERAQIVAPQKVRDEMVEWLQSMSSS